MKKIFIFITLLLSFSINAIEHKPQQLVMKKEQKVNQKQIEKKVEKKHKEIQETLENYNQRNFFNKLNKNDPFKLKKKAN